MMLRSVLIMALTLLLLSCVESWAWQRCGQNRCVMKSYRVINRGNCNHCRCYDRYRYDRYRYYHRNNYCRSNYYRGGYYAQRSRYKARARRQNCYSRRYTRPSYLRWGYGTETFDHLEKSYNQNTRCR